MASLALSLGASARAARTRRSSPSRRVDFHLKAQLVLALEVPAGRLLHRRVRRHPADAPRRRHAGRRVGDGARGHRHRARAMAAPRRQRPRGVLAAPRGAGRRQRGRAGAAQGAAASDRARRTSSSARCRTRASSSSAKANCASRSNGRSATIISRSTCCCLASALTSSAASRASTCSSMSSVTEGLGTSLLDAMACSRPIVATPRRRHPGSRRGRRERDSWCRRGIDQALAAAIVRLLDDAGASASAWARRGSPRVRERFTVERMVAETAAVYARRGRQTPRSGHVRVTLRPIEAAGVHHAEVAEREVVLHRIAGIERAQRRRDVARHRPPGTHIARQAAGIGRRG